MQSVACIPRQSIHKLSRASKHNTHTHTHTHRITKPQTNNTIADSNPGNNSDCEVSQHTIKLNTPVTLQLHNNPAYAETKSHVQSQHSFSDTTTLQVHSNPAYEDSTSEQQEQPQQTTPEPSYEVIPTASNQPAKDGQELESTEGGGHDYDVLNRGQSSTIRRGVALGVAGSQDNSHDYSSLGSKEGIKQTDNH